MKENKQITLPWASKFKELIGSELSETEIIKRYREYIIEQEKEVNDKWEKRLNDMEVKDEQRRKHMG